MKADLIDEAIQRAARNEMPLPLEELYLSWQAIDTRPLEVDLFVYDAGTDSGNTFEAPNSNTQPEEKISRITTTPFPQNGSRVGTFVFKKL